MSSRRTDVGLRWKKLLVEEKKLIIDNAVKDVAIYDEDGIKIGTERIDDTLKTDTSYRSIPISDRLIEQLLKHKENQKQRFRSSIKMKKKGRKWSENEYMFLSRTFKPYAPDTLSSALPELCDKYELERISPYGLRRSFATKCFESGVSETVLMEIMGHSTFQTTHQFYLQISDKVKQKEMAKVFENEKMA